jgi:hypothetical protein
LKGEVKDPNQADVDDSSKLSDEQYSNTNDDGDDFDSSDSSNDEEPTDDDTKNDDSFDATKVASDNLDST